jgi:hypothetical protein
MALVVGPSSILPSVVAALGRYKGVEALQECGACSYGRSSYHMTMFASRRVSPVVFIPRPTPRPFSLIGAQVVTKV